MVGRCRERFSLYTPTGKCSTSITSDLLQFDAASHSYRLDEHVVYLALGLQLFIAVLIKIRFSRTVEKV